MLDKIIESSGRNVRRALLMLQAIKIHGGEVDKILKEQWKEVVRVKIVEPCLKE